MAIRSKNGFQKVGKSLHRKVLYFLNASCLLLFFGFITVSNLMQPIMADDYSMINSVRHASLWQYVHGFYMGWSGRVANMIVQWMAFNNSYTRVLFSVLNGGAFFAFLILGFYLGVGRWPRVLKEDFLVFSLMLAAAWFGLPVIAEIYLWLTGAVVYFWPMIYTFLFLIPYRTWIEKVQNNTTLDPEKSSLVYTGIMLIWGIWVGTTSEQLFPAILAFLALIFLLVKVNRPLTKVPTALKMGMLGILIGGIILVIAPGNYVRLVYQPHESLYNKLIIFIHWIISIYKSPESIRMYILLAGIVGISYLAKGRLATIQLNKMFPALCWMGFSLMTLAPFAYLPYFAAPRTTFFCISLVIVAAVSSLDRDYNVRLKLSETKLNFIGLIILGIVLVNSYSVLKDVYYLHQEVSAREALVTNYKNEGIMEITIPSLKSQASRTLFISDIIDDPKDWRNGGYANFHGLKSVTLEKE